MRGVEDIFPKISCKAQYDQLYKYVQMFTISAK